MAKKTVQSDLSDVQASRSGKTRTFPRLTWDLMGPNKQGWEELKATPKELKELTDTGASDTKKDAPAANTAAKSPVVKQLTVAQQKKADSDKAKADPKKDAAPAKVEDTKKDAPAADEKSDLSPEDLAAKNITDQEGNQDEQK